MSEALWSLVAAKLEEHPYMTGVDRSLVRVSQTAEVFTPTALVVEILRYVDLELFAPSRTVLDPACGDGQFLVAAKWIKVHQFGMSEEQALQDIYGIDIMRENVDLCLLRLGGGTILMGDAMHPTLRLAGQTDEEAGLMTQLFDTTTTQIRRRTRVKTVNSSAKESTLF